MKVALVTGMDAVLLYIVLSMVQVPAQTTSPLSLTFEHRNESAQIELYSDRGGMRTQALKQVSHLVRCWRSGREKAMDPRLLQIVSQLSHHFGDAQIHVVSGYRRPPYGAPHSKHFIGHAMDLRIPGVPARTVRDYVWRNFRGVGVGLYPEQQFVHVDVREIDTGWVDHASYGEGAKHVKYFIRPANEPVQTDSAVAELPAALRMLGRISGLL